MDSQVVEAVAGGAILDQVDLFRPLPEPVKRQLESRLVPRALRAGEVLFNQGEDGDGLYLIREGALSVQVADPTLGLSIEVARLGPGQSIGEMALVTGAPRSASARAVGDTRLLGLSRDLFYHLVQAVPQVGLLVAGVLAKRLEQLNRNQGIEFGTLKGRQPDPALLDTVPAAMVKRHRMVPLQQSGGTVLVATPDPSNRLGLDDIRRILGDVQVQLLAVSEADFNAFVALHLGPGAGPRPVVAATGAVAMRPVVYLGAGGDREAEPHATASTQDIANLVTAILAEALERGVSDIHLEPDRRCVGVRYRIDGRLQPRAGAVPAALLAPMMSRLKVLAQLNITEKRLPQDGRISLEYGGKPFDIRVSTLASRYGESASLRVLDSSRLDENLATLIVVDKMAQAIRKLFYRHNGLVLVTGPTGSGKTTTLYAALRERLTKELSICTVEDPIEYDLPGVTQVQVNDGIGLGFSEVLRTLLRQDANILLVGETRDAATAKLACSAALTGHLVLTSFHANDAVSSAMRLRSMQVEPYLLASALNGVVNQRLVRRICPACRVEAPVAELVLRNLQSAGVQVDASSKFYKGAGCDRCAQEGFKGRVGVYELLLVNQRVREMVAQETSSAQDIRTAASDGSYVSLARYATHLLTQGYTVPSEIIRILPRDENAGM